MATPQDRRTKAVKARATDEPRSLIEIVTTDAAPVEMIPLFSIDGEVYSIPGEVGAGMALNVLDRARRDGMESAMSWALEAMLGTDSYRALLDCKTLTITQLEQIMEAVQLHVMGGTEVLPGK
jgi:hypothetical protein